MKNAQANKLSSSGVFICEINVEACLYASNESVNLCKSFNEFPFSIHDLRLLGYEDRYSEARRLKLEVDSASVLFQRMNLDESPGIPRAYQNRRPQTPRPTPRRFDEDWAWAESPPRNSRLNPPRSPPRTPPRIPNSFDANGSPVVRSSQTRRVPPPPTRRRPI